MTNIKVKIVEYDCRLFMLPWLQEMNPLTCHEGKGENHNNVTRCLYGQRVREENKNIPLYSSLTAITATAAAPVGIVSLNNMDLTVIYN